MTKVITVLLFSVFILPGCQADSEEEKPLTTLRENEEKNTTNEPDYTDVFIYEKKESSFLIAPPALDPAASYPVYEVYITADTTIEGESTEFKDLERGNYVKVWVNKEGEKEIAKKILEEDRSYDKPF